MKANTPSPANKMINSMDYSKYPNIPRTAPMRIITAPATRIPAEILSMKVQFGKSYIPTPYTSTISCQVDNQKSPISRTFLDRGSSFLRTLSGFYGQLGLRQDLLRVISYYINSFSNASGYMWIVEAAGFEPARPLASLLRYKLSAFDRSATPPYMKKYSFHGTISIATAGALKRVFSPNAVIGEIPIFKV